MMLSRFREFAGFVLGIAGSTAFESREDIIERGIINFV
jgi:hypothetical protein